ncbi:MAG: asparagine synthase (glutamine-hydrolyzing) [Planctomycetaceae bacterium]
MCGIAGAVWTTPGEPLTQKVLQAMTDAIRHRGPDDAGYYFSDSASEATATNVALGHRRLSIIDVAGGHQPLSNEDGTIWIIFNGEVYNYRELRPDLEARGHTFRTSSDTEVLIHAYEEYGIEALQKFRGMFAFAIWDGPRERLIVARDRIGQKPVFYRHDTNRLLFASELKSLLQVPGAPRELNPEAVDLFLTYQYVPHPHCILKGYHKLPPAHYMVYERGELHVERYWQAPYATSADLSHLGNPDLARSDKWTDDEWRNQLRSTLTEAVRLRMRSDVPVGAFLSGGIDSTIISGLMQSLSERPIHTFSIGFPIAQFDETAYAREAAQLLKTDHHEFRVEPSALETLPQLIWHYDEPFGDSSAIPTMYLSKVTRDVVTVSLSGDGGDELFCGYNRYQAVRLAQKMDYLPRFVRSMFGWKLWQSIPTSTAQRSFGRRLKRFLANLSQQPESRYLNWIGIFDKTLRRELYHDDFFVQVEPYDSATFIESCYASAEGRDFVTQTTCADVNSYLPCDILTKVDIASMAYSLECRSPFLDHHVAELAARMPLRLKQSDQRGKLILTETFRDLLPPSIQTRSKMGFGVPIDHWFRKELKDLLRDTLLSSTARNRGILNPATVERLIDEHQSGRWDHSYRLWNLVCLEQWCLTFLDPIDTPQPPPRRSGNN